jgi:hypothetical protein
MIYVLKLSTKLVEIIMIVAEIEAILVSLTNLGTERVTFEMARFMTSPGTEKEILRKEVEIGMADVRLEPKDSNEYAWDEFNEYANRIGIGTHEDAWSLSWEDWKKAYSIGYAAGVESKCS